MPEFNADSARRIARVTRAAETRPIDLTRQGPTSDRRSPGRRAIVTQAITPPSSASATHSAAAGWGFAKLQRWDDATSKYVSLGTPVRVINPWPASSTTATVGKVLWVEFVDGVWQMPGEICT